MPLPAHVPMSTTGNLWMLRPGQDGRMDAAEREGEIDYLRRIERLAHAVIELAGDEPWFAFGEEGQRAAQPPERAMNELATHLRFQHYGGDGCLEH